MSYDAFGEPEGGYVKQAAHEGPVLACEPCETTWKAPIGTPCWSCGQEGRLKGYTAL